MRPIDVVKRLCPRAKPSYIKAFEDGDYWFSHFGLITPLRVSHCMAQMFAETGGLWVEWESGDYKAERIMEIFGVGRHSANVTSDEAARLAHNGPALFERVYGAGNPEKAKELGNSPGDGWRLRGGGMMQTTGGANYRRIGAKMIPPADLYNHPEYILLPQYALQPALIEWDEDGLNAYADRNDLLSISRAINLGNPHSTKMPNGYADRQAWFNKIYPLLKDNLQLEDKPPAQEPAPKPTSAIKKKHVAAGTVIAGGTVASTQATTVNEIIAIVIGTIVVAVAVYLILHHYEKEKEP